MKVQILLYIFLLQKSGLEEGTDLLCCHIFIHHFCKHIVGDSEKQNNCRLIQQIILMETVLVDQAELSLGKYNIFPQNSLAEFSFYDISKFNIVMRVKLCFFSG